MPTDGKPIALYLSREGAQKDAFIRNTEAHCQQHGYVLWHGDVYLEQEQEPSLALE